MSGIVNSPPIGVENLVYAVLTDETTVIYGTLALISPVINVKINPKSNSDTLYADNRAVETVSTLGEVELETQDLPLEVQAVLLGHTLDAETKVMSYEADDIAPYVAVGFKVKKGNGKYRYVWLLKGKFSEPEEEHSTQEDKTKFQTPKLKGTFLTRADGRWKYTADEDSGFTGGVSWFTSVYAPGA
ncbi:major tail protein [Clostridium sp.]|uniref:major tail protein n=1 Tax=Clostridium sp. TaxID=1506 RepID=UPI002FDDBAD3